MQASHTEYPIFEANQVLTHQQLNAAVNYLEEQERLTRTNLIGIGIVCGLELKLDTNPIAIHLSQGCGISSEGYLLVESKNLTLVAYRAGYQPPTELNYPSLINSNTNQSYLLWELFEAGTDDTTPLNSDPSFITDKAVLLFLELKKENLSNCGPNNCDDKGSRVTVTIRRLLIKLDDLVKIVSTAHQLGANLTLHDLEQTLTADLNLPDLRLPRYDTPNTNPATAEQVLVAFQQIFQRSQLVSKTNQALSRLYQTFQSLVKTAYPTDPFTHFSARFSFLETALTSAAQVRFLPYYYDFFDDLLQAYKEFRDKGIELLCACCPASGLFPRHLILGSLQGNVINHALRQDFIASPINGECKTQAQEALQLFQRLVGMIEKFTESPPLPPLTPDNQYDSQIRITPSHLGTHPLSKKAIPYYYHLDQLALLPFWSPEKTKQGKAQQNLSYYADQYTPRPPEFITEPLAYELEPYNFLRIEGHIGKNYQAVLNNLLRLKAYYRLPIDVIALRAGVFDENLVIDPDKDHCNFQDLDSLYTTLRNELLCFLCKQVEYFYNLPIQEAVDQPEHRPIKLPLLTYCSTKKTISTNTLGWLIETKISEQANKTLPEIDISIPINGIIRNTPDLRLPDHFYFYLVVYIEKISNELVFDFRKFSLLNFKKRINDLTQVIKALEEFREKSKHLIDGNNELLKWESLGDRLEDILYQCKLAAFTALSEQYNYRLKEAKKKQYLQNFLQKHPGIQHKSGTTVGGTFILIYHDKPTPISKNPGLLGRPFTFTLNSDLLAHLSPVETHALNRVKENVELVENPDIQHLLTLVNRLPRVVSTPAEISASAIEANTINKIIKSTVEAMADGTVIADFFLPYLCCSECSPITFTLPKPLPYFTYTLQCLDNEGKVEVSLKPEGGLSPYSFKVDDQEYKLLNKSLVLKTGKYHLTVRDAEGTESVAQTLEIPQPLSVSIIDHCDNQGFYDPTINIRGGTPSYFLDDQALNDDHFTATPLPIGSEKTLKIKDANDCYLEVYLKNPCCALPCGGLSRRSAYRLWIRNTSSYTAYKQETAITFKFNDKLIELPDTANLLQGNLDEVNGYFKDAIKGWLKYLNAIIEQALINTFGEEGKNRLTITYDPQDDDPFDIFYIEHFTCDQFTLGFNYTYSTNRKVFSLEVQYLNQINNTALNGTLFKDHRNQLDWFVPVLKPADRNLCLSTEYKLTCTAPSNTLEPKAEVTFEVSHPAPLTHFKGFEGNIPPQQIVAWIWDSLTIETEQPFYTGQMLTTVAFPDNGLSARLTIITQDGCFGIIDVPVTVP